MKYNKLFSAMSHIDEKLIDEAVNAQKRKRLPVFKITAAAAAFVIIVLAATVLVIINKQSDIITESNTSNVQAAEKANNITPESKQQKNEGTVPVLNVDSSTKTQDTQSSSNSAEHTVVSTTETQTSEQTPTEYPSDEGESLDMLGFIIRDDKTYMQVFDSTEYTLDTDIGRVGDFKGYYNGLDDNSRVYTVKEDEKILVVKFEAGGSITLMRWDENVQDRMGYYRFNGLRVDSSLMAALSSNDGKAYSVNVTRPDSDDMYDYVYNGKTLRQMKEELEESWKTADGKNNPLETEYRTALDAFLNEKIRAVYEILISKGIQAELINEVRCEMTITKEQFETLAASDSISDEYAFGLSSGGYFADDPEA